jgi:hypothetical protein
VESTSSASQRPKSVGSPRVAFSCRMSSSTDNLAEDKAEAGVEGFDFVVQPSDALEHIILKLKEAVTRGVYPDQTAVLVSPMWI